MTINLENALLASDIKRLLKHVSGIRSITIKRSKSEIELALDEAHSGKVTQWNSVDDYFKQFAK